MKTWMLQIGSVVSAFLASICCIGPLLAVALGMGGLGAAPSLEVYRPYFLGVTFLFLGGAFYFIYGRKTACNEDDTCQMPNHWHRTLLWIVAATALIFAAAPYLLQWVV